MKDWNEGKWEGKNNCKTLKEYENIRMPPVVDCPNCGEHIELFVEKFKLQVHSHHENHQTSDSSTHTPIITDASISPPNDTFA